MTLTPILNLDFCWSNLSFRLSRYEGPGSTTATMIFPTFCSMSPFFFSLRVVASRIIIDLQDPKHAKNLSHKIASFFLEATNFMIFLVCRVFVSKTFIGHGFKVAFESRHYSNFFTVYDWSVITGLDGASCEDDLCKNGGLCLPGEGMRANPSPGTTACLCQPGFTGADCGRPMSSCAENPCKNKAFCTEDPSGGTGYLCNCDGTGFRGRHCELEIGSCGLDACYNGGACLEQPGGWLCQCPTQYGGMRCDNARASVSDMRLFLTDCATRYSIIGARKVLC